MDGEHQTLLKSSVELYSGYINIKHNKFRDEPSIEYLIRDSDMMVDKLKNRDDIQAVSQRFDTFVLFSTDSRSVGGMLSGIQPESEKMTSKLKLSLLKGKYLQADDKDSLYIGSELAKLLKVDIGDRVSFIGTGSDYSFCADNLTVKGIFQTGLFEFDSQSAFLNKSYFDKVFLTESLATEIVLLPKNIDMADKASHSIQHTLSEELSSESWRESMKSLVKAMELDAIFGYITVGILFIVILFVILIYTFLTLFARIKEIGVLRAVGTSQREIFAMLFAESITLSFIGVVVGVLIGGGLALYFNINPIEFGAEFEEQFKQYGFINTAIPTDFNISNIFRDGLIIFALSIGSTIYPIIKVNSYRPVEAIHHV